MTVAEHSKEQAGELLKPQTPSKYYRKRQKLPTMKNEIMQLVMLHKNEERMLYYPARINHFLLGCSRQGTVLQLFSTRIAVHFMGKASSGS